MFRCTLCIILLAFLGALSVASAQPPDTLWTRSYGGDTDDTCRSVVMADDGGFYLIGSGEADIWVLKVDQDGIPEWDNFYGGGPYDSGEDAERTDDGGLIITGTTASFGAQDCDIWLLKLDSAGNQEWSELFGSASVDYGLSVDQCTDGGFAVTGGITNSGDINLYILKTDESGEFEWEQSYGGDDSDIGYSIQQTSDSGFIITGMTYLPSSWCDLWLIKTDNLGNIEWEETYGDSLDDVGYSVRQTSDGGFIAVGWTLSFATQADILLLKTDSIGGVEWTATFGGSDWDVGDDVRQTMNGGYVLTGSSMPPGCSVQCCVIKTDLLGSLEWEYYLDNADYDEYGYSILQLPDGGYIIGGDKRDISPPDYNMMLIRLEPPAGVWGVDPIVPGTMVISTISPNPFCSFTDIAFSLPETAYAHVSVHDIAGRRVRMLNRGSMPAGENHIIWDGCDDSNSAVPSGIYLVHLESLNQAISGKLILLR